MYTAVQNILTGEFQQLNAELTVTASLVESGFHLASWLLPYSLTAFGDRQRQTISTDGFKK